MTNRPGIKLRQIEYFLAVAETLHFSLAAEKLFVTQPTLSHQLAELEMHIGKSLFDRSGKHVRLTQVGEVFRDYAKRALAELDAGYTALDELEGLRRGRLRVGVSQSFIRKLMPPIVAEFLARYPAIHLTVEEMMAPQIERKLAKGELDIAIAFAHAQQDDTRVEPILEERLMLVVASGHRLAKKKRVRLAELADQPLVLMTHEYFTRTLIEKYFAREGMKPNVACETNAINLMTDLARSAQVATILPEGAIDLSPDLRVIAIHDPVPVRVTALLWSQHHYETIAATTFAQLVRDRLPAHLPVMELPSGRA